MHVCETSREGELTVLSCQFSRQLCRLTKPFLFNLLSEYRCDSSLANQSFVWWSNINYYIFVWFASRNIKLLFRITVYPISTSSIPQIASNLCTPLFLTLISLFDTNFCFTSPRQHSCFFEKNKNLSLVFVCIYVPFVITCNVTGQH